MKRSVSVGLHFLLGLACLMVGIILIALLCQHFVAVSNGGNREALQHQPLGKLLVAAVLVPMAETALWSVAFVELSARFIGRPWIGALFGAVAYGVGYHWHVGVCTKLVGTWLGLVTSGIYVYERRNGRLVAYACALGLRWSFVAVGIAVSRSSL